MNQALKRRTNGQRTEMTPRGYGNFRTEMDRLFDRFFDSPFAGLRSMDETLGEWTPTLDISETDNQLLVTADVPGVDSKNLDISITNDVLTISGHKEETDEDRNGDFYRSERRFGSFTRRVTLPCPVDSENVDASYKDGVLRIRMNKHEAVQPRKISVKGG